jgi:hypothetical protein
MALLNDVPVMRPAIPGLETSWRGLYRAGAIAALVFVVLTLSSIVVAVIIPQAPTTAATGSLQSGGATLQYIADHRIEYVVNMLLFVGPSLLTLILFLALFVALLPVSKGLNAIGALIAIIATTTFISTFSLVFGLMPLSDQFRATTDATHRMAIVASADSLIAQINVVSMGGILYALGILLLSVAMLRGVFPRVVAYLGILTGVVGMICESLRPVIGTWYALYGILFVWVAAVGWRLYRVGASRSSSPAPKGPEAQSSW